MMIKKIFVGLAIGLLLLQSTTTFASVLTFDDINTTSTVGTIPNGYGGLDWSNMGYIKDTHGTGQYANGTVSGNYAAFNEKGNPGFISDSIFTFDGAYLTAAWSSGLTIDVKGFFSGTETYSQTVVVDRTSPTWFDFDFIGIDELSFIASGGDDPDRTHFIMDNFTFNAVPEPATMLLFGVGLLGIAGVSRRRK